MADAATDELKTLETQGLAELRDCVDETTLRAWNGKVLGEKGLDTEDTWQSILAHEGSVQHLEKLTDHDKMVFRTAFEIDQRWVIDLAADRTPFICQSQSINVYLPADIEKWDLHMLHWTAWERGCKSLYYLRSKSVQRASHAGGEELAAMVHAEGKTDYEECLACQ